MTTAGRMCGYAPCAAALCLLWCASPAAAQPAPAASQAAGMWRSDQPGRAPLELALHEVRMRVDHPVVETVVTQVFVNPYSTNIEVTYHYPVPVGATVTGMSLWVNGVRREARYLLHQGPGNHTTGKYTCDGATPGPGKGYRSAPMPGLAGGEPQRRLLLRITKRRRQHLYG